MDELQMGEEQAVNAEGLLQWERSLWEKGVQQGFIEDLRMMFVAETASYLPNVLSPIFFLTHQIPAKY